MPSIESSLLPFACPSQTAEGGFHSTYYLRGFTISLTTSIIHAANTLSTAAAANTAKPSPI
jgi:hypothetical protein